MKLLIMFVLLLMPLCSMAQSLELIVDNKATTLCNIDLSMSDQDQRQEFFRASWDKPGDISKSIWANKLHWKGGGNGRWGNGHSHGHHGKCPWFKPHVPPDTPPDGVPEPASLVLVGLTGSIILFLRRFKI